MALKYIHNKITYCAFMATRSMGLQYIAGYNMANVLYRDPGAKVTDGIYIGSLATATSKESLDQMQIGAIINLSGRPYCSDRPVFSIVMEDMAITAASLDDYVDKFIDGVHAIESAKGEDLRVLVHCAAGVNRSATLIGFYLLSVGWTYDQVVQALELANDARGVQVLTNPTFRKLLRARETYIRKKK